MKACKVRMLVFPVLERRLLQLRKTDSSFVFIIFVVLIGKIFITVQNLVEIGSV